VIDQFTAPFVRVITEALFVRLLELGFVASSIVYMKLSCVFAVPSLHVMVTVKAPTSFSVGVSVIRPVRVLMLNSVVSSECVIVSGSGSVQFTS